MKLITATMVGLLALVGATTAARADVAALFADGHGGIGSNPGTAETAAGSGNQSTAGLGYGVGARLLIFEGYYDHTGFGGGAGVSRGILGLRGGFGTKDARLVLRAGGGVIEEQGGALSGRASGMPERSGEVGRVGAAFEGRVSPLFLVGIGVDGEAFSLPAAISPTGSVASIVGTDLFANFHLLFELGV
jgi:hypothetical protein